jgi:hypothetical protein
MVMVGKKKRVSLSRKRGAMNLKEIVKGMQTPIEVKCYAVYAHIFGGLCLQKVGKSFGNRGHLMIGRWVQEYLNNPVAFGIPKPRGKQA